MAIAQVSQKEAALKIANVQLSYTQIQVPENNTTGYWVVGERFVEVRGHNLETSDDLARRVEEIIGNVAGITDTRMSRETGTPEKLIIVDRQKGDPAMVKTYSACATN